MDEIENEEDDEGLTPEEQAERKEAKLHQQFSDNADRALNRWAEAQPAEVQQAVVDDFIETGIIDHEKAGVAELEAQVIEAAFTQRVERSVLSPLGLSLPQWNSYISESDAATLRSAIVKGQWSLLQDHAQKVASYISQNGDVNKGSY